MTFSQLHYLVRRVFLDFKINGFTKTLRKISLRLGSSKIHFTPKENIYVDTLFKDSTNDDLVSIVIPFKDKPELLQKCIGSILKSTYTNFEIIGVNNNSVEQKTFECMQRLQQQDSRIRFVDYNVVFNFPKINNYAVQNFTNGKYLVFMNNDIELISADWIEWFLSYVNLEKSGTVGAKLYYPNDTLQHAGVAVLDKNGISEHIGQYIQRYSEDDLYTYPRYVMSNTAALMMMKKETFEKIGGFDEKLAIDYNDVDLSLKCIEHGYKNIWIPFVEAYHYESVSRGDNWNVEKLARFEKERRHLARKHADLIKDGDIYYETVYR